jgi:NitT/TauT family transport system substrate-binding protein
MNRHVLICLLLLAGCSDSASPGTSTGDSGKAQPVRLALNWYPEVEHGGYIAAEELGLFRTAAVDVEIIPGGPQAPQVILSELATGRIDFAVSDADNVVKARAAGVPAVALMAPLQTSPRCIMVHKSSGFQTLGDLKDIELAISESRPFALWMKRQLPLTGVRFVPFNGLVGEFVLKRDFAQQGFVFSEPFLAKEQGSDPQVLMVSDLGFDPYASVLMTTESVIAERPDVVRAVVEASVRGWKQYLAEPATVNAAIGRMNDEMTPAALQFGTEQMAPLCRDPNGTVSCGMTLERWTTLVQQIEEVDDVAPGTVRPEDCFTTRFLPAP